jgi:hypothetical protein
MPNLGTESVTGQYPMTRYANQAGWTLLPKERAQNAEASA